MEIAADINVTGRWDIIKFIECETVTEAVAANVSRAIWDILEALNNATAGTTRTQLELEMATLIS